MYRFPKVFTILFIICTSTMVFHLFKLSFTFKNRFTSWNSADVTDDGNPLILWNRDNSSDKFCVWFNFTKATKFFNSDSITVCLHGSIGYAKFVFDHAQNWDESISVALLVDSYGFTTLKRYLKLHKCSKNASEKVTTHLVWKQQNNESCSSLFILDGLLQSGNEGDLNDNCNVKDYIRKGLLDHSSKDLYYSNSLRNIARKGANTNLHLIADSENHFSFGASKFLSKVTKNITKESKHAVIVRRFEYNMSYPEPRTVKNLINLFNIKQAFEFHHFYYAIGHSVPELSKWFEYSKETHASPSLYPVKYRSSIWEPQLIVHASAPYHFEGFSLIRDQTALPYELCRAGYKFFVASHSFSFHTGIKPLTNSNRDSRYSLIAEERSIAFKAYLDDKYGKTDEATCKAWL